jgi:hypothetical protein
MVGVRQKMNYLDKQWIPRVVTSQEMILLTEYTPHKLLL